MSLELNDKEKFLKTINEISLLTYENVVITELYKELKTIKPLTIFTEEGINKLRSILEKDLIAVYDHLTWSKHKAIISTSQATYDALITETESSIQTFKNIPDKYTSFKEYVKISSEVEDWMYMCYLIILSEPIPK